MKQKLFFSLVTLTILSACQISGSNLQGNLAAPNTSTNEQIATQPTAPSSPDTTIIKPSTDSTSVIITPKLFLVSIGNDAGQAKTFGCQDSIVEVTPDTETLPAFSSSSTPEEKIKSLTETLSYLLSQTEANYQDTGLYNSLYQSKLNVKSITITNHPVINLEGTLTLDGTCDAQRVTEQLTATISQFFPNSEPEFNLNEKPLYEALSLK